MSLRVIRRAGVRVARFAACALALVSVASCAGEDGLPPGVRLEFVTDTASPHYGSVEAWPVNSGYPTVSYAVILRVTVGDTFGLSMLGSYSADGNTLRFRPRFPPKPGVTYFARWEGATRSWRVPPDSGAATTVVTAVYPNSNTLPVNLLRMYVEFSEPMATGRVLYYAKLYAGDSLLSDVFSSVEWDPDKRRLTLSFDRRRSKLREGGRYRLVIDSAWPDAAGRPLRQPHVKAFQVQATQRDLVRTENWKLAAPKARTRDSLIVTFPRPLDFALLNRLITVWQSGQAQSIAGQVVVSDRERRWAFVPRFPWQSRRYSLRVGNVLEDVAGNSISRLFDARPGDVAGPRGARTIIPFDPR